jgi:tellurite resistance protein
MIDAQRALIYTMVLLSAADGDMTDAELTKIGEIVRYLPVFQGLDARDLTKIADECSRMLGDEDGLDKLIDWVGGKLTPALRETAYALAVEVAAANGHVSLEVLRVLEMLRDRFELDRLMAGAIEFGARARHRVVSKTA